MHGAIISRSVSTSQASPMGTPTVNSLSSFMIILRGAGVARSYPWRQRGGGGLVPAGPPLAPVSHPRGVLAEPPDGAPAEDHEPGQHVHDPGPVDAVAEEGSM